jgi:hypothetical protein
MERSFSSFEEIDTQLEILRVQRQISVERLRLQLRDSPRQMLREGWQKSLRPALQNMAIDWMLSQLRDLRRKLRPELPPYY